MTEKLTAAEIEAAQIGPEAVFTMAARQKLIEDIMKLSNQRLSLEREIKAMLPTKFIEAYQGLVELSLGVGKDYRLDPDGNVGLGIKDGGRDFKSGDGGLRDDAAARYRRNVDRQLRGIARKMMDWTGANAAGRLELAVPVRCGKCSKFCDSDWKCCAWCGEGLRGAVV